MRWVYKLAGTVLMAALVASCGSGAGDQLVLQFLNFQSPPIAQTDVVSQTSAEVDIVQDECPDGSFEPFGETYATAVFINQGGADIQLDTIDIDTRAAGSPPVKRQISAAVIGGRCANNSSRQCALDTDCPAVGGGAFATCQRTDSTVTFFLFDFATKFQVSPGTYDIPITFSGQDTSESRFTVRTHMTVTFADFDNCSASTGGGQ
jgi:hypothetical protein